MTTLIERSLVSIGFRDMSLLLLFGFNSGWLAAIIDQMSLTLNLYRMSYMACLSAGRLSMNDSDDSDYTGETIQHLCYPY
jgi:hypothetical protein